MVRKGGSEEGRKVWKVREGGERGERAKEGTGGRGGGRERKEVGIQVCYLVLDHTQNGYIYTFISRVSYSLSFSPLISFPSGLWGRGRITQHSTGRQRGHMSIRECRPWNTASLAGHLYILNGPSLF